MPPRRSKNQRRIAEILDDIPRQAETLVAAMARFSDDFDPDLFVAAHYSSDPDERAAGWAVEHGLEVLQNHLEELAARGLNEAQRLGALTKAPGHPYERLRDIDVISARTQERLELINAARNDAQHDYPVTPETVHEAVLLLRQELPGLVERFQHWFGEVCARSEGPPPTSSA